MKQTKQSINKYGINALVWSEGAWFVAKAVEVEVASQGKTAKQALINLQEALELYFENEKIPPSKVIPLPNLRLEKLSPIVQYA